MNDEEKKIVDAFDWPCNKRTAHGPHKVGLAEHPWTRDCPGVKAHPLTQIGKR